jgi:pimeloyl-ACP methyl ester carboxylesterase
LARVALLPELVVAAASLASVAPYGADGLDYFASMGQGNVDEMTMFLNDPEAARALSKENAEGAIYLTPDLLFEVLSPLLSPADQAAFTLEVGAYLVETSISALAPGDDGAWEDSCAHFGDLGFDVREISVPVQLWQGKQDTFVPFQHGEWLSAHPRG